MTYNEFEERVLDLFIQRGEKATKVKSDSRSVLYHSIVKETSEDGGYCLVKSWRSGGVGGGSCWDDGTQDNHYSFSGESEPSWDALDLVVRELFPSLSYIHYTELMRKQTMDNFTEYEYYGNSSNYHLAFLSLRDIYNFVIENGYAL